MKQKNHAERAHSKYSASGAERWFNCPGSVELSEGQPDKSSPWALEGTQAHEVLEQVMLWAMNIGRTSIDKTGREYLKETLKVPKESLEAMLSHGINAANFILGLGAKLNAPVTVETRIYLDFIHPEMFGTFDGAVLDHFGTLHVFDYKYGAGHSVSPKGNLQMIFYGIGLAHAHHWNFKRIRLWIIQPRIKGYDGPLFWELTRNELHSYVAKFQAAVDRVEKLPKHYAKGGWCHWCKAKSVCPLKIKNKLESAQLVFAKGESNGKEKSSEEKSSKVRGRGPNEKGSRKKEGRTKTRDGYEKVSLKEFSEVRFLEDQDFY